MRTLKHRVDQLEQRSPAEADPIAIERSITSKDGSGRIVDCLAHIWVAGLGRFTRSDNETEAEFRGRIEAAAKEYEQQKGRADG